ncbi:MAG: F0F1 ATP synthase subunit B [Thermodesulfobacteriota bacterium]|nr:F0F1 ATP synthase subunit B [Thermodesulfobacteriota bacterium]
MNSRGKWKTIGVTSIAVISVLSMAGLLYASGGEHGGGHEVQDSLSPAKLKDLLWRTLNFAALMIILVKFLAKPLVDGLRGRREGIREQFDSLEAQKSEAEREYKEYEAKIAGMDAQLDKMIDNAIAQGEVEKKRIIEEANQAADNIKRQAENAVQNAISEAKKELKDEIADKAAIMAEEIIKKNLQDADQVKLVENYLDKVGAVK